MSPGDDLAGYRARTPEQRLQLVRAVLDAEIMACPTGPIRNALTEANVILMQAERAFPRAIGGLDLGGGVVLTIAENADGSVGFRA